MSICKFCKSDQPDINKYCSVCGALLPDDEPTNIISASSRNVSTPTLNSSTINLGSERNTTPPKTAPPKAAKHSNLITFLIMICLGHFLFNIFKTPGISIKVVGIIAIIIFLLLLGVLTDTNSSKKAKIIFFVIALIAFSVFENYKDNSQNKRDSYIPSQTMTYYQQ